MVKKVLFFGIAIILGFMVLVVSSSGFYLDNIQKIISSSIEEKRYDDTASAFLPFYDENEVIYETSDNNLEDTLDLIIYQSVIQYDKKITDENDNEMTVKAYDRAYTLFIDDITFDLTGEKIDDNKIKNHTKVVFKNDDLSYDFDFIAGTEGEEGYRNYIRPAEEVGFVEVDIAYSTVEKNLNGAIDTIEVYDGHNKLVFTKTVDLTFETEFFNYTKDLVDNYNKYLSDKDSAKFQEFYDKWYEGYKQKEGFGLPLSKEQINMTGVYLKTGGVVLAYIALCVCLGFLILRGGKKSSAKQLEDANVAKRTEVLKYNLKQQKMLEKEEKKCEKENQDEIKR